MIELNNYAQNQYINTFYPWEGKLFRRPATDNHGRLGCPFSQGPDNTVGAYRCHFDLNKGLCNLPVRIRFEGVERAYYLWLNGHFVGYAEDSFAPHEFDFTPFIKDRGNLLAVEFFKHSTASWLEDQDMFRFSGIFRPVRLLAQAKTHLEDFSLRPLVEAGGSRGNFNLTAKISGQEAGKLRILVKDASGQTVLSQEKAVRPQLNFRHLNIQPVQFWDHRHPYLYQLLIEVYGQSGRLLEQVPYRFGFRQIMIDH